ncbi:hypothetical protein A2482_05060 [Candidatus Falkowbacteria bacterium RIFOXYC2_FULL_48_21]|uniref:HTH arsR-type domain-containing protein n=1 Tax=Candidatus Falkowbacteria bacterium RIFOXYC2_FULL_48_21 TaxID=1798005 RepID=A0A1F5TEX1_9BACT|nr:MAG: hypothetical protein A2482_05060 [Candidatus Falkowbacteria bacterium RIFOXYC2_FULL_48_21]
MFEQLFGSKTRVKLIRVFLDNPGKRFFVRELTRLTDSLINSVRREMDNLLELKLIIAEPVSPVVAKKGLNTKKFYYLNEKNLFLPDLNSLFAKGKILLEKHLVEKICKLGQVKYLSFGGSFVDDAASTTDVFIVGQLDQAKVKEGMRKFEEDAGRSIRYTILDENEYRLRRDIGDRFLDDILSNPRYVVVVDHLERRKRKTDQYE